MKKMTLNLFGLCLVLSPLTVAQNVDLTDGIWAVSGIDAANSDWEGSTLAVTGQSAIDGMESCELQGYFIWMSDTGSSGGEIVTGTLDSNLDVRLQGIQLISPMNILIGTYFAQLAPNGNALINGNWSGNGGIPSDDWSAVRTPNLESLFRADFERPCDITFPD